MKLSKLDNFKYANIVFSINRFIQIILALILIFSLNYLGSKYYAKFDITKNKEHSLSPENIALLKSNLDKDVEIYVVTSRQNATSETAEALKYIKKLLPLYEYNGYINGKEKIKVKYVDKELNNVLAEKVLAMSGQNDLSVGVYVFCKNAMQVISFSEFFETKIENFEPVRVAFKGEEVISAALLKVLDENPKKIYFVKGHDEMSINSTSSQRGLSELAHYLKQRNFICQEIDLSISGKVPQDADLLVVASPLFPFVPVETRAIINYLSRNGYANSSDSLSPSNAKLILLMGRMQTGLITGLEELFEEFSGIKPHPAKIMDIPSFYTATGDLMMGVVPHKITQYLIDSNLNLQTADAMPLIGSEASNLKVTPLIVSSNTSWAETDLSPTGEKKRDKGEMYGNMQVAVLIEKAIGSNFDIELSGGELALFGTSDFISNQNFSKRGNFKLFMNTVNYLLGDEITLNIPSKSIKNAKTEITNKSKQNFIYLMFIPFICIITLAIFVRLVRR